VCQQGAIPSLKKEWCNDFEWSIGVFLTQLTIWTDFCSVTVAFMEPQLCLSSFPLTERTACESQYLTDWRLFRALSLWQQEGQRHSLCFLFWYFTPTCLKNCTLHFLEPRKEDIGVAERDSHTKLFLLCWRCQCVISDANSVTLEHLQSLIHHDSSPITLQFCKLKSLCTLLTMHSVTFWLAGTLAAVSRLVLDCVQPHGSWCDLKAYLH